MPPIPSSLLDDVAGDLESEFGPAPGPAAPRAPKRKAFGVDDLGEPFAPRASSGLLDDVSADLESEFGAAPVSAPSPVSPASPATPAPVAINPAGGQPPPSPSPTATPGAPKFGMTRTGAAATPSGRPEMTRVDKSAPETYGELAAIDAVANRLAGEIRDLPDFVSYWTRYLGDPNFRLQEAMDAKLRNRPTAGDRVSNAVQNFNQALLKGTGDIVQAPAIAAHVLTEQFPGLVGTTDLDRSELYQAGASLKQFAERVFPGDERLQNDFLTTTLAQAGGSMVPFAAGGELAAILGVGGKAAVAALGAAQGGSSQFEEAREAGATPEQERRAFVGGAAMGATEALGVEGALPKITARGGGANLTRAVVEGSIPETAQEIVQTEGGNFVANTFAGYDPNRPQHQGVAEAGAAAFILGGGAHATGSALGGDGRPTYPSERLAPDAGRFEPGEGAPDDVLPPDIAARGFVDTGIPIGQPEDMRETGAAAPSGSGLVDAVAADLEGEFGAAPEKEADPHGLASLGGLGEAMAEGFYDRVLADLQGGKSMARAGLEEQVAERLFKAGKIATREDLKAAMATVAGFKGTFKERAAQAGEFIARGAVQPPLGGDNRALSEANADAPTLPEINVKSLDNRTRDAVRKAALQAGETMTPAAPGLHVGFNSRNGAVIAYRGADGRVLASLTLRNKSGKQSSDLADFSAEHLGAVEGAGLASARALHAIAEEANARGLLKPGSSLAATAQPTVLVQLNKYLREKSGKPLRGAALDELDRAFRAGQTDRGTHQIARYLLSEVDPDFDLNSALQISDRVGKVVLSPQEQLQGAPNVKTRGQSNSDATRGAVRTAVQLFRGHDARNLVEGWYLRAYDQLPQAEKARFDSYHGARREGGRAALNARELFGFEGSDFFFSDRLHERAEIGIRQAFQRARATLIKLVEAIRGIRGAKVPAEIEAIYRRVGSPRDGGAGGQRAGGSSPSGPTDADRLADLSIFRLKGEARRRGIDTAPFGHENRAELEALILRATLPRLNPAARGPEIAPTGKAHVVVNAKGEPIAYYRRREEAEAHRSDLEIYGDDSARVVYAPAPEGAVFRDSRRVTLREVMNARRAAEQSQRSGGLKAKRERRAALKNLGRVLFEFSKRGKRKIKITRQERAELGRFFDSATPEVRRLFEVLPRGRDGESTLAELATHFTERQGFQFDTGGAYHVDAQDAIDLLNSGGQRAATPGEGIRQAERLANATAADYASDARAKLDNADHEGRALPLGEFLEARETMGHPPGQARVSVDEIPDGTKLTMAGEEFTVDSDPESERIILRNHPDVEVRPGQALPLDKRPKVEDLEAAFAGSPQERAESKGLPSAPPRFAKPVERKPSPAPGISEGEDADAKKLFGQRQTQAASEAIGGRELAPQQPSLFKPDAGQGVKVRSGLDDQFEAGRSEADPETPDFFDTLADEATGVVRRPAKIAAETWARLSSEGKVAAAEYARTTSADRAEDFALRLAEKGERSRAKAERRVDIDAELADLRKAIQSDLFGKARSGLPLDVLPKLVRYGALKIEKGFIAFNDWLGAMVEDLGEDVRQFLLDHDVFAKAKAMASPRELQPELSEPGAQKAPGKLPPFEPGKAVPAPRDAQPRMTDPNARKRSPEPAPFQPGQPIAEPRELQPDALSLGSKEMPPEPLPGEQGDFLNPDAEEKPPTEPTDLLGGRLRIKQEARELDEINDVKVAEAGRARTLFRYLFNKAADYVRHFSPKFAEQIEGVSLRADRLAGGEKSDLDALLRPFRGRTADLVLAMKEINGFLHSENQVTGGRIVPREATSENLSPELKKLAADVRRLLDRGLNDLAELGVERHLPDGRSIPLAGSGKAYPQAVNAKGREFLDLAEEKGLSNPEVLRYAEGMVERGEAANLEHAIIQLRRYRDSLGRGMSPYFETTRVDLPEEFIEWDPRKTLPVHLERAALLREAIRAWGPQLETAWAAIEKIRAKNGGAAAGPIEKYFSLTFGRENEGADPWAAMARAGMNYQAVTKLSSPLSWLRNAMQPYTNLAPRYSPWTLAKATFAGNRWTRAGRALREKVNRAGAVGLKIDAGPADGFGRRFTEAALAGFSAAELQNQHVAALAGWYGTLADLAKLAKLQKSGRLYRAMKTAITLGDSSEGAIRRRLEKAGLSDRALVDRLAAGEKLSEDQVAEVMQRVNESVNFRLTLASTPLWYKGNELLRLMFQFKNWSVRQTELIYNDVLVELRKGNAAPFVRFVFAAMLAGEIYNALRDLLFSKEESITMAALRGGLLGPKDVAGRALRNLVDGGGVGMLADMSWGLVDFVWGPMGGTIRNLFQAGEHVMKEPSLRQAKDAAVELAKKEVAPVRLADNVFKAADDLGDVHSQWIAYNVTRERAFKFKEMKEFPGALGTIQESVEGAIKGRKSYETTGRTLAFRKVAELIAVGEVDAAADYLAGILREGKNGRPWRRLSEEERGDVLQAVKGSMRSKAPFGPVAEKEVERFLRPYSVAEHFAMKRTQEKWLRAYERALERAEGRVRGGAARRLD